MSAKTETATENASSKKKTYKAPALEKGLMILEAIAGVSEPLSMTEISKLVGRSNNEIVRLIYVLEDMGFIEKEPISGGYQITSRLFTIANARPASRSLLEIALPQMREMAARVGQSCHIVVRTETKIVVIGRVEAHKGMSLSVRVGHNRSIIGSASGTVLFTFLKDHYKPELLELLYQTTSSEDVGQFIKNSEKVLECGFERTPNNFLQGINDFSVPVYRSSQICAALTVPFVPTVGSSITEQDLVSEMKRTARKISELLPHNEDY